MEEINIFLDDKITIYYLNLFDNNIKDENYFKIGIYLLEDDILNINYDNGTIEKYSYLKNENNIKYFGDYLTIDISSNNTFSYIQNNLSNNSSNGSLSDANITNNNYIYIVHKYWEDKLILDNNICYRIENYDKGKYILNTDNIIIKWDNYNEEKFLLKLDDDKYYLDNNNNNDKYPESIKILIKNFSWQDYVILDTNTNKCVRLNINEDNGTFIINGNYLSIKWDEWESEIFYKNEEYYVNNKSFIKNKKFIIKDSTTTYEIDKESIYINDHKYKYNLNNKKLIINDYECDDKQLSEFILLDDEYYSIYYFEKYKLHGELFQLFKNENIILNNLHIIIAKYNKINTNILNIQWYNNDNFYYKTQQNNDEMYELIQLQSIKMKNDIIQSYYIFENLLYDEHFNNFIEFIDLDETHLTLDKNIQYIKKDNIFILIENINKTNKNNNNHEIILYDNQFETFYYDNNYLIKDNKVNNLDSNYLCLFDNDQKNIHIKKDGDIKIFNKLYDNNYIISNKYQEIMINNFDESIFKYFENHLEKDNLIQNIMNEEIICNIKTFYDKFVFLGKIDFNSDKDIFENYGYFIIQEFNWTINDNNLNDTLKIINFKNNKKFMEHQDLWIDYLNNNNQFMIFIFDDFSHYEFINKIIDFQENYKNYIVIINYIKCDEMIHFYINKLITHIEKEYMIICSFTYVNYLIEMEIKMENDTIDIKKQNNLIINNDFYKMIFSKEDLIIFAIYFYIKNRSIFNIDYNFDMSLDNYKKIII